jgi:hypothetical protein
MDTTVGGLIVYVAVFALGSALLAHYRRRNALVWLVFGGIIGPAAILLLAMAPPGRCPVCGAGVHGWLDICVWCGSNVRGKTVPPHAAAVAAPDVAAQPSGPPTIQPAQPLPVVADARAGPEIPTPIPPATVATLAERARSSPPGITQLSPFEEGPVDVRVLASGVFIGGTVGLEVGQRYEIGRRSGWLAVLGPVDSDPGNVRIKRPLDRITATWINNRLVLTEDPGSRRGFSLVFDRIAGMTGDALEASLQPDEPVARLA